MRQIIAALAAAVGLGIATSYCWWQWGNIDFLNPWIGVEEDRWGGLTLLLGWATGVAIFVAISLGRKAWRERRRRLPLPSPSSTLAERLKVELTPAYLRAGKKKLSV